MKHTVVILGTSFSGLFNEISSGSVGGRVIVVCTDNSVVTSLAMLVKEVVISRDEEPWWIARNKIKGNRFIFVFL